MGNAPNLRESQLKSTDVSSSGVERCENARRWIRHVRNSFGLARNSFGIAGTGDAEKCIGIEKQGKRRIGKARIRRDQQRIRRARRHGATERLRIAWLGHSVEKQGIEMQSIGMAKQSNAIRRNGTE